MKQEVPNTGGLSLHRGLLLGKGSPGRPLDNSGFPAQTRGVLITENGWNIFSEAAGNNISMPHF